MIRVSQMISFTRDVRPACLEMNTDDKKPDAKLHVTGWGSGNDLLKIEVKRCRYHNAARNI